MKYSYRTPMNLDNFVFQTAINYLGIYAVNCAKYINCSDKGAQQKVIESIDAAITEIRNLITKIGE